MIRLIVILVLAFLLPFVVHGLVTLARHGQFRPLPHAIRGRAWLVAIGLVLSAGTLFGLMGRAPHALGDRYIPAHEEGGVVIPGRFVPAE